MTFWILVASILLITACVVGHATAKDARKKDRTATDSKPDNAVDRSILELKQRLAKQKSVYNGLRRQTVHIRVGRDAYIKLAEMMDAYEQAVKYVCEDEYLTFSEKRVIDSLSEMFDHNLRIYKNFSDNTYHLDKMDERKAIGQTFVAAARDFIAMASEYTHTGREGKQQYQKLAERVASEIKFAKEMESFESYLEPDPSRKTGEL